MHLMFFVNRILKHAKEYWLSNFLLTVPRKLSHCTHEITFYQKLRYSFLTIFLSKGCCFSLFCFHLSNCLFKGVRLHLCECLQVPRLNEPFNNVFQHNTNNITNRLSDSIECLIFITTKYTRL